MKYWMALPIFEYDAHAHACICTIKLLIEFSRTAFDNPVL